jgi:sugar O-acyltransferase (sialic acid O-acetyltransferase NeuD family)
MVQQINAHQKQWNLLGFFDDGKQQGARIDGLPVLGGLHDLNATTVQRSVAVAVSNPQARKKIVTQISNPLIQFPVLIHPSAQTGSDTNTFEQGTIITAGVILTTSITLGGFVIVNLATTIGHDVQVGAFTAVMPGCRISGNVRIGEEVLLGTGAVILQNLTIGKNSKVGAGAVVIKEVAAGHTVVGVPAKPVKR